MEACQDSSSWRSMEEAMSSMMNIYYILRTIWRRQKQIVSIYVCHIIDAQNSVYVSNKTYRRFLKVGESLGIDNMAPQRDVNT